MGLLTVIFGIILLYYRKDDSPSYSDWFWPFVMSLLGIYGIIAGILVCIAGTFGFGSHKDPQSCIGIGCSICVCCLSVVGIAFFSAAMA